VWGSLVTSLGEACYEIEPRVYVKPCDREETMSLRWTYVSGAPQELQNFLRQMRLGVMNLCMSVSVRSGESCDFAKL
jgi:hypothetical protein